MLEYCYKNVGYRLKNTCNPSNSTLLKQESNKFLEILVNESLRYNKTYYILVLEFLRIWYYGRI